MVKKFFVRSGGVALEWGLWRCAGTWCSGCGANRKLLNFLWKRSRISQEHNGWRRKTRGGHGGPEAVDVTVTSPDGEEFTVKRDHACTSGTLKALLSGPGHFAENETKEANFRETPHTGYRKCPCILLTGFATLAAPRRSRNSRLHLKLH